ncbi:MAG: hypothetical protein R2771_02910 [Saprospiraceae bacterium]
MLWIIYIIYQYKFDFTNCGLHKNMSTLSSARGGHGHTYPGATLPFGMVQ